ncbi:hypothetical protein OpiT1DRAFT_01763 [Opitutaceae bacterium TAV1]|nr:hypothetical protein OpiT1DRAFT_01763 [Opitutaceae bacterium TAV1]
MNTLQQEPEQDATKTATGRADWRKQVTELVQPKQSKLRPVPVEPEATALLLYLAEIRTDASICSLRKEMESRTGRRLSRCTVVNLLQKHGVVLGNQAGVLSSLEQKIVKGDPVSPGQRTQAFRMNPALSEHRGPGEGTSPGDVLAQSIFPLLPGRPGEQGKWQVCAVVDTWGMVAFVDLQPNATQDGAVDLLHYHVLPWYEEQGTRVRCLETSRATLFAGDAREHVYEAYLNLHGIEHRLRGRLLPTVNGYMARFKQVLTNGFLFPLRKSMEGSAPPSFGTVRTQLILWVRHYNETHPSSGYRNEGRPPLTFWRQRRG